MTFNICMEIPFKQSSYMYDLHHCLINYSSITAKQRCTLPGMATLETETIFNKKVLTPQGVCVAHYEFFCLDFEPPRLNFRATFLVKLYRKKQWHFLRPTREFLLKNISNISKTYFCHCNIIIYEDITVFINDGFCYSVRTFCLVLLVSIINGVILMVISFTYISGLN